MDRAAALAALGVTDDTPLDRVRQRYLALLRTHHPDVAGAAPGVDPAVITEAYRVVRSTVAPTPTPQAPTHARAAGEAVMAAGVTVGVDGDTVVIGLPADETFLALLDVAGTIGSVSYVDRQSGLLETIVELTSGTICSVVVSLQGRATGVTDAFCTVEAVAGGPPPPADLLARELAELLAAFLNS